MRATNSYLRAIIVCGFAGLSVPQVALSDVDQTRLTGSADIQAVDTFGNPISGVILKDADTNKTLAITDDDGRMTVNGECGTRMSIERAPIKQSFLSASKITDLFKVGFKLCSPSSSFYPTNDARLLVVWKTRETVSMDSLFLINDPWRASPSIQEYLRALNQKELCAAVDKIVVRAKRGGFDDYKVGMAHLCELEPE